MEIFKHFERIIAEIESPVIIELGGYDGGDTKTMLELLGNKNYTYHLFEPNRKLLFNLFMNLAMFKGIEIFNAAIGNTIGISDFYISSGENCASSSIRKPHLIYKEYPDMKFIKDWCTIITLDYHIESMRMDEEIIDFIWADIQGAEVDLIKGGEQTFKKVRYLYTEYSDVEFYKGEINLQSILGMLPDFEMIDKDGGNVLLRNKKL